MAQDESRSRALHIVFLIVIILMACLYIYPVFLMVDNSFKPFQEILTNVLALPSRLEWKNYTYVIEKMEYFRLFVNSSFTLRKRATYGSVVQIGLKKEESGGFTYSEAGINGASTSSWAKCSHWAQDLSRVMPDLVIFSIGINDIQGHDFDSRRFKENYRFLIRQRENT